MKRRILQVVFLVMYLLLACTLLSVKIQDEMMPLVMADRRYPKKDTGAHMSLESRSIFIDENGDHLYEALEGEGWESGLRAREIESFGLNVQGSTLSLFGTRDYIFIHSASRQPIEGEAVKIVDEFEAVEDVYLYYYADGVYEGIRDFPDNTELLAETDRAYLLRVSDAMSPFLPHYAKTRTIVTDISDRIFSLAEAEAFLQELPKAVLALACLCFGLVVRLLACAVSRSRRDTGGLQLINIILGLLSLAAMYLCLHSFDFPASVLPADNIFKLSHYGDEYKLLLDILGEMGCADALLQAQTAAISGCMAILSAALLAAVLLIAAELSALKKADL